MDTYKDFKKVLKQMAEFEQEKARELLDDEEINKIKKPKKPTLNQIFYGYKKNGK